MPHQLWAGLRAGHDLLELGQECLGGDLVTELQVDEVIPAAPLAGDRGVVPGRRLLARSPPA